MSTWEERMTARSRAREHVLRTEREALEAEVAAAREAVEDEQAAIEGRERFAAGPPDGCPAWSFSRAWSPGRPCMDWVHGPAAKPGPPPPADPWAHLDSDPGDWCWHPAHDDGPLFCGVVAMAV